MFLRTVRTNRCKLLFFMFGFLLALVMIGCGIFGLVWENSSKYDHKLLCIPEEYKSHKTLCDSPDYNGNTTRSTCWFITTMSMCVLTSNENLVIIGKIETGHYDTQQNALSVAKKEHPIGEMFKACVYGRVHFMDLAVTIPKQTAHMAQVSQAQQAPQAPQAQQMAQALQDGLHFYNVMDYCKFSKIFYSVLAGLCLITGCFVCVLIVYKYCKHMQKTYYLPIN